MIILDTNVVSALMMTAPDPRVIAWLDRCPSESVWTTAVTVFEVWLRLQTLAVSRKRKRLEDAFELALREDFQAALCPSTSRPPSRQPAWRRGGGAGEDRSIFGTPRSPGSR